ncbi:MAG: hypothetical protein M3298_01970 [Thermoproteota archaeon]|nr:hypothetical protein [Thermoproteota archaeon]MDQ3806914.1 hypothetical protein [Thermoproteota archaeon]MDQ5841880.1 hypothetical protein [Thermoproteota archaeon]
MASFSVHTYTPRRIVKCEEHYGLKLRIVFRREVVVDSTSPLTQSIFINLVNCNIELSSFQIIGTQDSPATAFLPSAIGTFSR